VSSAANRAVTVLSPSGQESSEEIDHLAHPRRVPSGTAFAHFASAMAWIALLVFGCLALANRFFADRSFEDYRALFLSANEQAFKSQLRTSGSVLGCVLIAVSLVVLITRLWEAAESPGQKTLIALWAAFVCLVVFVFRRSVLVFRATNPAIGTSVNLDQTDSIRGRQAVEKQSDVLALVWEQQVDLVSERARLRARTSLMALVVVILLGAVAGAVVEFVHIA
jgi:hypothetical protein